MGLRVCVLGSGSGGNCTLVDSGRTRLLIDAARLGQRYILERLAELGVRIEEIDGVLATHMHGDHVDAGVTYPICHKNGIPLFVHDKSIDDLMRRSAKFANLDRAGLVRRFDCEPFMLRDLTVLPFGVPHGAGGWNADIVGHPVGFRITLYEGASESVAAYATDLGEVTAETEELLLGADILVLESNHDVETEIGSGRPQFLIDWVIGPQGHLSNEQSANTLKRLVSRSPARTRNVILAHLSEQCNTPDLALETARRELDLVGVTEINLGVAWQKMPSPEIIV